MPHDRKNYNKMQCLILTPIGGPRGYPGSGGVPLPDGRGSVKAGGGAVWRRIFCSFSSSRRARKKARSKRSWNLASGSSMASRFSSGYTSENDGLAALGTHQFPLGDGHFFEQSHFGGYLGLPFGLQFVAELVESPFIFVAQDDGAGADAMALLNGESQFGVARVFLPSWQNDMAVEDESRQAFPASCWFGGEDKSLWRGV